MTNYDYECRACGDKMEKNVPIADRDAQSCSCGGELRRLITFFGSVWSPTRNGGHS